jgi:transcriptional regulator with XRE-family HTH domain/tetratricopeptide (TPR) repeat protein
LAEEPGLSFAVLLRQLRAEARMTQEELAEAASLSPRSVSDLERGINRTARKDTALLLAGALKLTGLVQELFVAAARGRIPPEDVLAAQSREASGAFAATPDGTPAGIGHRYDDAGASNLVWVESAASRRFVGREAELGALQEAWSRALAGHRVLALVAGEPGVGKTALAAELARLVHADKGLVLYGRWNEEVLAPYQAFREALGDYGRACPEVLLRRDLRDLSGDIARLCPELGQRVGAAAAPPVGAAEAERFRLFGSLDTWVQRIAARHPVLLILDDLHWADRPSFLLLLHLMQVQRSTPLLAVAMYRDVDLERSEVPAALPSLTHDTDCRRVSIGGLEPEAVAALVEAAVGRALADRERALATELERATAGNPFFILEMARHLSEIGAFDQDVVRLDAESAEIPESVRDVIRWRLARLSEKCAEALSVASVVGEQFDAAVLGQAATIEDADLIDLLEEAARAGLIAEIHDEPDLWRFSHSVARRVIADTLSGSRKARLHKRIGTTLESRPGTSPAELAHHFGGAASIGTADKAVGYERMAGKLALGEVAAEVAVRHYRRALELHDRFGPEGQSVRCELLLELAAAYDRAGEYPPRDERFAEVADIARRLGRNDLFLQSALGYGGVLPATVHPDARARALLEEALERSGEEDSAVKATILARLAHWLHNECPYPERLELSDRSVAMARASGDRQTLATVLLHRCWALDGPANVGDALEVASEILDIGTQLDRPELTLEGLRIRLAAQFERGAHSAAVQTALAMNELAEQVRHPEFIRLAAMWDVTLANLEGRFEDAEKQSDELHGWLQRIGHPQAPLILVAQTFPLRWLQGRAAEYLPIFEALSASEPTNLAWRAVTAWSMAEGGEWDRAVDLLRRTTPDAAATADENYLWWAVVVGFADAVDLLQDQRWAEVLYDMAIPYAGNNCTLGLVSLLGSVDHWLGVLAAAAGRFTDAVRHLETALERHQAMAARPFTALTEEALAHVLSLRGHAADARRQHALVTSALQTADELGLAGIAGRARLRGSRPPGSACSGLGGAAPRALVEKVSDVRVHVDGGPGPDDRVEVGVAG